jgi:AI-2 transport system permease protein
MKIFLEKLLEVREITVAAFLIIIFIIVGVVNHAFLAPTNVMLTLIGSTMYIFLAIGMTFVILTKEIDVSVGAILGICATVSGTLLRENNNIIYVVLITLLIGAAAGLINGLGVTKLGVPSIVMTLGTMGILRGLMFIYSGGKWVENIPDYFKNASGSTFLGIINTFVLMTLIIVVLFQLYLSHGKKGKYFAAVGDNIDGATLIGIPVTKIRTSAFLISGVCSAIAGLVYASQIGFVGNVAGSGSEMTTIAACVLGGVSLNGGVGSVVGATFGAIIMNTINSALVYLKVPAYWNNTISGTLLIAIVVADRLIHNYLTEKTRKERLSAKSTVLTEEAYVEK